jgi:hypothetical protein
VFSDLQTSLAHNKVSVVIFVMIFARLVWCVLCGGLWCMQQHGHGHRLPACAADFMLLFVRYVAVQACTSCCTVFADGLFLWLIASLSEVLCGTV